jgi:hypothetical protein
MSKDFNTNTENNDVWLTPPKILKELGDFDLDPCYLPPEVAPWKTANACFHLPDDGLKQEWYGRVWCNPPYGKETFKWLSKLAEHRNGLALIFCRTETIGFHEEVWAKADAVFFFKGRLKFYKIDGLEGGTANAPSCLVIYGQNNVDIVRNSNLKGKLVILGED